MSKKISGLHDLHRSVLSRIFYSGTLICILSLIWQVLSAGEVSKCSSVSLFYEVVSMCFVLVLSFDYWGLENTVTPFFPIFLRHLALLPASGGCSTLIPQTWEPQTTFALRSFWQQCLPFRLHLWHFVYETVNKQILIWYTEVFFYKK